MIISQESSEGFALRMMDTEGGGEEEEELLLPETDTVGCPLDHGNLGFDHATSCWKGGYCACDSASSSTMCSSKQADSAASCAADIHSEQKDVMSEILTLLLCSQNDDNNDHNNGCNASFEAARQFSCKFESKFFSWDDLWDLNAGPAPEWEGDCTAIIDDWMLDVDMIGADDGVFDLEGDVTNPA